MNKVEVVVDREPETVRGERFIEWVDGWLRARYVVDAYSRHNNTEVVFVLRKDMFRLFEEMYRVVEYMRWKLNVINPVVICSGDECIDVSDNSHSVLVSGYKIKKLRKARNIVKRLIKDEDIYGVSMITWFDFVILNIGCHGVLVLLDEVVAIAGLMLDKLYHAISLKVLRDARDYVYSVVEPIKVDLDVLDVEVEKGETAIRISLDGCVRSFTYDEALRLTYKLLQAAVNMLTDVRMIMKRDYGIE
jgi:hypothetical protein